MKEKTDWALEQVNLTSFVGQKEPGLNPAVVLLTSLVTFNITQTKNKPFSLFVLLLQFSHINFQNIGFSRLFWSTLSEN